jgi:hypothetical protein
MAEQKEETYRLKDQDTSFYDDETGLNVTRDQTVKVGPGQGKRTRAMIKSGGLIKVDSSAAEAGAAKDTGNTPKTGKLPDDFPGQKALEESNVKTYAQLEKLTRDEIEGLKGIGPKTADEIEVALGRSKK